MYEFSVVPYSANEELEGYLNFHYREGWELMAQHWNTPNSNNVDTSCLIFWRKKSEEGMASPGQA